jgi:hypothetical protein
MKKIMFASLMILAVSSICAPQTTLAYTTQNINVTVQDLYYQKGYYSPIGQVICTPNQKLCVVGKYKLQTNGQNPLIVNNGMVCTSDGRMCTNGNIVFKNGQLYTM